MTQDLAAQREYTRCTMSGIGFAAHNDYWFYRYAPTVYSVMRPVSKQIVLDIRNENLGFGWIEELRKRVT